MAVYSTAPQEERRVNEIYGSNDPALSVIYHPFYITNDPVGGNMTAPQDERRVSEIYKGGNDPASSASYHPLNITNDPVGGNITAPQELRRVTIGFLDNVFLKGELHP